LSSNSQTSPGGSPEKRSATFPALHKLTKPLLDYNVVIAIAKEDVGAVNILKDAIRASNNLRIDNLILALGPTTPLSLRPPLGSRILWATFTDGQNHANGPRLTIVPPTQLTDLSLSLEKLSKTRTGRIPLIVGDFLDNVLSVSSAPTELYSFLCKLFTRIRTNGQTAFFVATDEMHDSKKTAILKRFADVVIEYRAMYDLSNNRLQARIFDHAENNYAIWEDKGSFSKYENGSLLTPEFARIGRQPTLNIEPPGYF